MITGGRPVGHILVTDNKTEIILAAHVWENPARTR
jgi:hypothetical protein